MRDNGIPTDALESGKRKLLIVDDDQELVELMSDAFARDGRFDIKTANNGFDAGMPAGVNNTVGSSRGIKTSLGRRTQPFDSKNERYFSRSSSVFILACICGERNWTQCRREVWLTAGGTSRSLATRAARGRW